MPRRCSAKIRRKYKEYGIQEKPFIIVKADAGTYGMGIMTVRDPKELADLNRRSRNKMSVIKDGQEVSEVILQEGVPTNERVNDSVAEPVVYMIDRYVVGGFYRVNPERGNDENLNSPGASFVPLAFAGSNQLPKAGQQARRERAEPVLHVRRDRAAWRWSRPATSSRRPTPTPRSTSRRASPAPPRSRSAATMSSRPLRRALAPAAAVSRRRSASSTAALTLGAIGVVYGDIGTSPLYALKEVFANGHVPLTPDNVFGVLSLVFWTLTVVVSIKYVVLILRADNNGEGGLIAMLALASQAVKRPAGAAPAAAPGRHLRHRDLLRRRRHHAGDLGARRGRGPRRSRRRRCTPGSCRSRWSS